jgi:hypothetical protein
MRPSSLPRAFTLVEAIIAVVVLSVAVPPMLWALRAAHDSRIAPTRASTARWLAVEKLEDLIADRHSLARGYDYLLSANYPAEPAVPGFPAFARDVAIYETAADLASVGTGYKRLTVTITWTNPGAAPQSLAIATIVTDYPS